MNFELMDGASSLLSQSEVETPTSVDGENEEDAFADSESEVSSTIVFDSEENLSGVSSMLAVTSEDENWLPTVIRQESEDGLLLLEGDTNLDGLDTVSDVSSLCGDRVLGSGANSETAIARTLENSVDSNFFSNGEENLDGASTSSSRLENSVHSNFFSSGEENLDGASASSSRSSTEVLPLRKGQNGGGARSIFEISYVPLWGFTSVCGRRSDMEDAVSIIPYIVEIPLQMLVDLPPEGLPSTVTGHFFGVFDGHGGAEVANYCKDRIHSALVEEFDIITTNLKDGDRREELWTRAFTKCFLKVDDEIIEEGGHSPVARDTVGSTAIIAIVCTSHIIVANCGDSRAVLCRGKEAIALSVDHKPDREDEFERIIAAGGMVIDWGGCRVSGVLAMSRSIGDRYLNPPVISEPEVMILPRTREDECLILASDGLWDEISNEEACSIARRAIQLWYRNNTAPPPMERGEGTDPASQAAAEALMHRAHQKGSGDNISVVVLDLKRHRKGKTVISEQR